MKCPTRNIVILLGVILIIVVALILAFFVTARPPFGTEQIHPPLGNASGTLPMFTPESLLRYDGTDPVLPIYIGLDGYVYDVTEGRAFYATGGEYHDLAGKDASASLHFFGGDIIKKKYPIIGVIGQ